MSKKTVQNNVIILTRTSAHQKSQAHNAAQKLPKTN